MWLTFSDRKYKGIYILMVHTTLDYIKFIGHGLDDPGIYSQQGRSCFLFKTSRPVLAPTYPPAQWISRALYQGVTAAFASGRIPAT